MVTKQDAVKLLNDMGFDVVNLGGMLMAYGTDDIKAMKKAVKKIGYEGSYGCTSKRRDGDDLSTK